MAQVKFKVEITGVFDPDEYQMPADGNLTLQLKEDITEAIESSISVEVNTVKVTRGIIKNEDRDFG